MRRDDQRVDFNSRPSARGDRPGVNLRSGVHISIHAPPRGATNAIAQHEKQQKFQFTPLREGRQAFKSNREGNNIFQFTPLREGRRRRHDLRGRRDLISIHAPPRGATAAARFTRPKGSNFNSRPSARGDLNPSPPRAAVPHFNSRPSARGDSAGYNRPLACENFNSRPSARGDRRLARPPPPLETISIHAPPRGATVP